MTDQEKYQDLINKIESEIHDAVKAEFDAAVANLPFLFQWAGRKIGTFALSRIILPIDHAVGYIAHEVETKTVPELIAELHFLKANSSYGKLQNPG